MLLGLDHAIIAVRDLPRASEQLTQALGLTVVPGGDHPGAGTRNAIVRFGTDYLELMSVRDAAEAASEYRGRYLLDFLKRGEGLLGFALSSDDLSTEIAEAVRRGLALEGPIPGGRRKPDGSLIRWSTARSPQDPWGHVLPFLIQHETPIQERRRWVPPEGHPLRVSDLPGVSVAVGDLESAAEAYRHLLGEPPELVEEVPALPARRARFRLGSFAVDLLQPTAESGGLADFVRQQGDGLFMVSLAVPNVDEAVADLRRRGTSVGNPTRLRRAPLLDPSQTLGARFQLVESFSAGDETGYAG